jgi:hypothetical protein
LAETTTSSSVVFAASRSITDDIIISSGSSSSSSDPPEQSTVFIGPDILPKCKNEPTDLDLVSSFSLSDPIKVESVESEGTKAEDSTMEPAQKMPKLASNMESQFY